MSKDQVFRQRILKSIPQRFLKLSTIGTVILVLLTIGCYWFWATGGTLTEWMHETTFYDEQAEGFRRGHLYSALKPNPNLLKQADPLSVASRAYWHWDYSFYKGRLYMYWGLAPAVALALLKSLFGIRQVIGDELVSFCFVVLRLIVAVVLVRRLAQFARKAPPEWAILAAMLVFAFANPTPFTLARGAVYEGAINGGTFFITAGFLAAHKFLWATKRSGLWLAIASCTFALAGACRASQWLGGAAALGVLSLAALLGANTAAQSMSWRRRIVQVAWAAALPYGAVCGAHLAVNFFRFGSWSEFGVTYQMGFAFDMGPVYILPNLWQYILHPLHASCQFPFLDAKWHVLPFDDFPKWLTVPPRYYYREPVAGFAYVYPICWILGLSTIAVSVKKVRRLVAARNGATFDATQPTDKRMYWFLGTVVMATVCAAAPVLLIFASSMRYEADVMPGLQTVVILSAWRLLALPVSRTGRIVTRGVYAALCALTVSIGAMYGFTGYAHRFATHNPVLMAKLVKTLSVCPSTGP